MFVQRRFAGSCPFLIKLVTRDGTVGMVWKKLRTMLNPNFDIDRALAQATGEHGLRVGEAVDSQMLYVLYQEEMKGKRILEVSRNSKFIKTNYFDKRANEWCLYCA